MSLLRPGVIKQHKTQNSNSDSGFVLVFMGGLAHFITPVDYDWAVWCFVFQEGSDDKKRRMSMDVDHSAGGKAKKRKTWAKCSFVCIVNKQYYL